MTTNDVVFERTLGRVLRTGVLAAAAIVAIGAVMYLSQYGMDTVDYQAFRSEPADLRSVSGILRGVGALSGRGIIQFGLLLLVATPVARVVFSVVGFIRQRDWLYVVISAIVLLLLAVSLFGG